MANLKNNKKQPYYSNMKWDGSDQYFKTFRDNKVATVNESNYLTPFFKDEYIVKSFIYPDKNVIEEEGKIGGIPINIINQYDKNWNVLKSDSLYNNYSVNNPVGKALKNKVEYQIETKRYQDGGDLTYYSKLQPNNIRKTFIPDLDGKQYPGQISTYKSPYSFFFSKPIYTVTTSNKPHTTIVSERGEIGGIPVLIENTYDKNGNVLSSDSIFNGLPVQFPKGEEFKDKLENRMQRRFQQGGQMANQLGQIAKAAFEMANNFKKQGAITEVAGEQAIAQAFQQAPEAAKVFVDAIKKKDAETILKLFTQLGIVK